MDTTLQLIRICRFDRDRVLVITPTVSSLSLASTLTDSSFVTEVADRVLLRRSSRFREAWRANSFSFSSSSSSSAYNRAECQSAHKHQPNANVKYRYNINYNFIRQVEGLSICYKAERRQFNDKAN